MDSQRFQELQQASTRDVKAVGMVGASTALEMVEYIRELERKVAIAEQGLRDCVDPIGRLRRNLKEDEQLNGYGAMRYAETAQSYIDIATSTLREMEHPQ